MMDKAGKDRCDYIVKLVKEVTEGDLLGRELVTNYSQQTVAAMTKDVISVGFDRNFSGSFLIGNLLKKLKVVGDVTTPIFFLNEDGTSFVEIIGKFDETATISHTFVLHLWSGTASRS